MKPDLEHQRLPPLYSWFCGPPKRERTYGAMLHQRIHGLNVLAERYRKLRRKLEAAEELIEKLKLVHMACNTEPCHAGVTVEPSEAASP